jgi:hypothetical protein
MNGAPLADADVQFFPEGPAPEGYMGSAGKTDANGNYELYTGDQKGAVEGRFKVIVSKLTDPQGNPIKEDPTAGIDREQIIQSGGAVESIPPQFSDRMRTTLSTEVIATPGKPHVFDIEIKKP